MDKTTALRLILNAAKGMKTKTAKTRLVQIVKGKPRLLSCTENVLQDSDINLFYVSSREDIEAAKNLSVSDIEELKPKPLTDEERQKILEDRGNVF